MWNYLWSFISLNVAEPLQSWSRMWVQMIPLLPQVLFFLHFKKHSCFYLLRIVNFSVCHLSGQVELTENRSLENKDGVLCQQKFKIGSPSASRLEVKMDLLSANLEWGCFAGTGSSQNKPACEFSPREDCGGLWSRLHLAGQKSALVMPGTGGPGAAVPPPRTSSESRCLIQIIVMNCSALEVERTQLMEEGG